ncbi:MAG: hypothetical protein U0V87_09340 [Acidobacteriota bacterium]
MAVYERRYRAYDGPETATWSRFLIPTRYAFQRLFESKGLLFFLVLCSFFPVGCTFYVYIVNNLSRLAALGIEITGSNTTIGPNFFLVFFEVQATVLGMVLTLIVGPGVVSPDLANNGLPLYLVRPFSKWEYALGKLLVLVSMLSLITWLPALLLFGMQVMLAGGTWLWDNLGLLAGIVTIGLIQCVIYALVATAVSATVKWRPVAAALLFAIFAMGSALGLAMSGILGSPYGSLLDVQHVLRTLRRAAFGGDLPINAEQGVIPVPACVVMLAIVTLLCLWQLSRRLKAYEVVR